LPTAIVTGGARGIGTAIADALAAASFDVAVVDVEPVPGNGSKFVRRHPHDVADVDGHAALVATSPIASAGALPGQQRRRDVARARRHARPQPRELRPLRRGEPARGRSS
jgi:NAD(P)-dependent dehydrogenase (short-subunit alcohol dehydrogenase family)